MTTSILDDGRTLFDESDPAWAEGYRNALHSGDSPEWYSPELYVEAARKVLDGIELDPASHDDAQRTVQAARYYTAKDNGLAQAWTGRIFLNPPGGLVRAFWLKLLAEPISEAVWIGYSLEQLQTLQRVKARFTPLDFPMCIPAKRIAFVESNAKHEARLAKLKAQGKRVAAADSPSHGNYVTYIGARVETFVEVFSAFGQIVIPMK